MMTEKLQKARDFEAQYVPHVPEAERPKFHVTGGIGWINDPNGFSVYKGEYHLFFQYHPYTTKWGPMHWGHVKTKDFITWERLPVAIAPDTEYDKNGCFSGSAIEMPDGRQLLMYTGVRVVRSEDGALTDRQTQCIAIGDGIDFDKYEMNPVITADQLPEGGSKVDFRDPKIWRENGKYMVAVGNRTADGSGTILIYESENAMDWKLVGPLASCHNQYGRMWECPDFFELDGKKVLLVSPQEMTAVGLEYHIGNGTVCIMGHMDEKRYHLIRENAHAIDYGIDFYAPQTLETPDGRRIMIAWMQSWDTCNVQPSNIRIYGAMTVPRELRIVNGRLIQNPVRELENYRGYEIGYNNVAVSRETTLPGVCGRVLDMTVTIRPSAGEQPYHWFKIKVAKDGRHETMIRFNRDKNMIRVDRTRCGLNQDIVHRRDFLVNSKNGELKLRIVMDKGSLELFANDGEQAASFSIYTPQTATDISFEADQPVMLDVKKYDLEFDAE